MDRFTQMYEDIKKGADLVRICRIYGGDNIYIPRIVPDYKQRVQDEFNGYNHKSLASKYNVTVSQIYSIIRENKQKQKGLFDD